MQTALVLSRDVKSTDGGMYQCLAVNEDEESQASAQIVLGNRSKVPDKQGFSLKIRPFRKRSV